MPADPVKTDSSSSNRNKNQISEMLQSSLLMLCYLRFPGWLQQGFGFTSDLGLSILSKTKIKHVKMQQWAPRIRALSKSTSRDVLQKWPKAKKIWKRVVKDHSRSDRCVWEVSPPRVKTSGPYSGSPWQPWTKWLPLLFNGALCQKGYKSGG